MILWMASTSFLRYVGTLLEIMFHLQYHIFLCISTPNIRKVIESIHPVMINEMIYCIIAHTLVIQFKDIIAKYFNLHWFYVMIHDGCETMVHGIQNLHPNGWCYKWMFVMPSIWCHGQPFFKNYDLRFILWIKFSHLFNNFMHADPHYIFYKLPNMGIS